MVSRWKDNIACVLSKYILNNAADERVALFSLYVYTNALDVYILTALHSVYK